MHRATPWKNGLGVSYTIADFPHGADFDTVDWQVGHTAIGADCPFSHLAGMDRLFMVIEGRGVELTCVDEAGSTTVNRIEPLQSPFAFRGDSTTRCRLIEGSVKVFNVMTRRGKFKATVEVTAGRKAASAASGETLIAVDLASLDAWILDASQADVGRAVMIRIARA